MQGRYLTEYLGTTLIRQWARGATFFSFNFSESSQCMKIGFIKQNFLKMSKNHSFTAVNERQFDFDRTLGSFSFDITAVMDVS